MVIWLIREMRMQGGIGSYGMILFSSLLIYLHWWQEIWRVVVMRLLRVLGE
jgi:hypothetical protein